MGIQQENDTVRGTSKLLFELNQFPRPIQTYLRVFAPAFPLCRKQNLHLFNALASVFVDKPVPGLA